MTKETKKILLFFPSNKTTIAMISLFKGLKTEGIEIELLTINSKDILHFQLEELGFKTHSLNIETSNFSWLKLIWKSYRFFKRSSSTIIFSHLKPCTLVTLVLYKFIKQKVFSFRHHIDHPEALKQFPELLNKNQVRGDRILNQFSPNQVVPCETVFKGMVTNEKANPNRLKIIPYMYDFDMYPKPNLDWIQKEKELKTAHLRVLLCSRLVSVKRHLLALKVLKKVILDLGLDLHVYILDEGPEIDNIKKFINENKLDKNITLTGFTRNYIDYMKLCDILLHPSISEASNSVVKEMALQGKASIVCDGVGDFSDYIHHEKNGYLVPVLNPEPKIESILINVYHNKSVLKLLGEKARETVLEKFSINNTTILKYLELLDEKK